MKQWVLSKYSFEQFLAILDANPELAGQKYEALRLRLVKFFEWRACSFAEDLADETIDRVARKIDAGEQIVDYIGYTYQVAKLLYLENLKRKAKEQAVVINMPVTTSQEENPQLDCLESCLQLLTEENRRIILGYYYNDKQAKIDHRKKLAETLGLTLNALRIKTNRIRTKLEECVFKCLKK
jgi:DNA-directed RNA polymerase specialized sigma24 family protein